MKTVLGATTFLLANLFWCLSVSYPSEMPSTELDLVRGGACYIHGVQKCPPATMNKCPQKACDKIGGVWVCPTGTKSDRQKQEEFSNVQQVPPPEGKEQKFEKQVIYCITEISCTGCMDKVGSDPTCKDGPKLGETNARIPTIPDLIAKLCSES
jgi:hypothetical protein